MPSQTRCDSHSLLEVTPTEVQGMGMNQRASAPTPHNPCRGPA